MFRNLGVAEFEYLRLFEQERLSSNTSNSEAYDTTLTRSSSADISANAKVEQMLEQFGIIDPQVFQPVSLLNGQENHQTFEAGSPSDSSESNTTTNPSLIDNTVPLSKSPPAFGSFASLPTQIDPRQLMFALTQFNELRNSGTLNSLSNNQLSNGFVSSKGVTLDSTSNTTSLDSNEKQQTSPTIKRQLEENDNLMKMFSVKKRRMNGIFGNVNMDEKWKREMLEVCNF